MDLFRNQCSQDKMGNISDKDVREMKRLFIERLQKDASIPGKEREIKIIKKIEKGRKNTDEEVVYFEKNIGLKLEN